MYIFIFSFIVKRIGGIDDFKGQRSFPSNSSFGLQWEIFRTDVIALILARM